MVRFFNQRAADEIAQVRESIRSARARTGGDLPAAAQTLSFCQELTIAVANQPRVMLVATLPSSQRLEVFSEEATVDLGRLQNIFRRIEHVLSPVEGTEIYEVLRRRLFEDIGPARVHRQVAQAFWEDYRRHLDDTSTGLSAGLPRHVHEPEYRDRMIQAYPFHHAGQRISPGARG